MRTLKPVTPALFLLLIAGSASADLFASRTICVIPGKKTDILKLKIEEAPAKPEGPKEATKPAWMQLERSTSIAELTIGGKPVAKVEVAQFVLSDEEARKKNGHGLLGNGFKSEEAFEYQGEQCGFKITFLNETKGYGFLKLDHEKLIAEIQTLGAEYANGHLILACKHGSAKSPRAGSIFTGKDWQRPGIQTLQMQLTEEAFESLREILGDGSANGSIHFVKSARVGMDFIQLDQLNLLGDPADFLNSGSFAGGESFVNLKGKIAQEIFELLEKSGRAKDWSTKEVRSFGLQWKSEETPNASYELSCRKHGNGQHDCRFSFKLSH